MCFCKYNGQSPWIISKNILKTVHSSVFSVFILTDVLYQSDVWLAPDVHILMSHIAFDPVRICSILDWIKGRFTKVIYYDIHIDIRWRRDQNALWSPPVFSTDCWFLKRSWMNRQAFPLRYSGKLCLHFSVYFEQRCCFMLPYVQEDFQWS